THYKKSQIENSSTKNLNSNSDFNLNSENDKKIQLFYSMIDISLNKDFADYNFGAQLSNSKTQNYSIYENPNLEDQNSRFNYDETIYSGYFSISKDFDEKWSLKIGLRSEYTTTKGNSISLNQITQKDYLEFFPSAYLSYTKNRSNIFTFSYGRRVNRPSYDNLDPFRIYISQYNYQEGNPFLRPAYNNNFELKHL